MRKVLLASATGLVLALSAGAAYAIEGHGPPTDVIMYHGFGGTAAQEAVGSLGGGFAAPAAIQYKTIKTEDLGSVWRNGVGGTGVYTKAPAETPLLPGPSKDLHWSAG